MTYQVRPMFSVPLYQANLGPVDPMARAWIMNLSYPHQSVGVDNSELELDPVDRGMHIKPSSP